MGFPWILRKVSNLSSDVRMKIIPNEEGVNFLTLTKLKNIDSFVPFTGTAGITGMHGEVCNKLIKFWLTLIN